MPALIMGHDADLGSRFQSMRADIRVEFTKLAMPWLLNAEGELKKAYVATTSTWPTSGGWSYRLNGLTTPR